MVAVSGTTSLNDCTVCRVRDPIYLKSRVDHGDRRKSVASDVHTPN